MPLRQVTAINSDTPVVLLIEALEGNLAWQLLKERVLRVRDSKNAEVYSPAGKLDYGQLQRLMGYVEGLNRIVSGPHLLEAEWKTIIATEKREADKATRQRASLV